MSTLDWLLLAIIAVSALGGLMRGFVGVTASIAAWLLGGWAALSLGGALARVLSGDAEPGPVQMLLGYGLCFASVAIGIGLVAWIARRLLRRAGLGAIDRGLGFAAGLLRGGLAASLLVLMLGFTPLPRAPQWRQSALVPMLEPGARWIAGCLPEWAMRRLDLRGYAFLPAGKPLPA